MSSVKNLFVVVMLLGVSYGAIQVINTPNPTQETDASFVDEIDIQMGERNHESLEATLPPLATNYSNDQSNRTSGKLAEPGFPPLPPNMNRKAPPMKPENSVSRQPELTVPEVEIPQLDSSKLPYSRFSNKADTPQAFVEPRGTAPEISAPPVSAPPANAGSFSPQANSFADTSNPPPMTENPISGSFSSGGGAFGGSTAGGMQASGKVDTRMEPVVPKPSSPAASGNRFIKSADQFVNGVSNFNQNVRENLGGKADQLGQQVQQSTQPTRDAIGQSINKATSDAAKMLDNSKAGILDRANEFTNRTKAAGDTVANLVTESIAPIAGTAAPLATYLPSHDASTTIDWKGINQMANNGQAKRALSTLSKHYSANLAEDQRLQMLEWLDVLAGKTIYSTEHLLQAAPYVVKPNDNLETLAQQWRVPARLIYMVNKEKISNPSMLVPGTELKVVQGPFNAMVSVDRQELTIFLGDMYAGRFPIEMGSDGNGLAHGTFAIREKLEGKAYSANGESLAAGAINNPYGKYWLGLGDGFGIHEFNTANFPTGDRRGSIRVSSNDAADIYGILSNGSQVTITR